LTRDAYAKWVPLIGREPWPMIADYDVAVRDHLIDLLTVDGELVALVEMIAQSDYLLVENLAVAPAHQSRLWALVDAACRASYHWLGSSHTATLHQTALHREYCTLQVAWRPD
jgi:hypothetical protein